MQTTSIVFIVETSSGDRFFCGFGKKKVSSYLSDIVGSKAIYAKFTQ
ncbi:hypothetical protein IAH99_14230 [Vibrio cholerae]|nr:hypothetical protein [Vibrio cholerae]MBC9069504.1 hypothetical protein [Vibrio cholerae]